MVWPQIPEHRWRLRWSSAEKNRSSLDEARGTLRRHRHILPPRGIPNRYNPAFFSFFFFSFWWRTKIKRWHHLCMGGSFTREKIRKKIQKQQVTSRLFKSSHTLPPLVRSYHTITRCFLPDCPVCLVSPSTVHALLTSLPQWRAFSSL